MTDIQQFGGVLSLDEPVSTSHSLSGCKRDVFMVLFKGEREAVTLNTQKRCSIKSLPNHLVIHLKRFDFDFDTMQQTKVRVSSCTQ